MISSLRLKLWRGRMVNRIISIFCPIQKMVVFESFKGRQYSDNPRAISEKMHECFPDYEIVWGITDQAVLEKNKFPDYVRVYITKSLKYRRLLSSAAAFVRNEAMTENLFKRKGQIYIQTWHGDRGIKKILYDSWIKKERPTLVMDNQLTDLFVVGSEYAEKRIQTAFRYHGEVLATGCPRNDCLIHPHGEMEIRKALGVRENCKILLYAPTLRKNSGTVQTAIQIGETLEHLKRKGGDWVCLVRAHPKSLGLSVQSGKDIVDVSAWPDMADLLMVADMLITDYSSCAGDYVLRKKPLILAQFDLEQYMQEDRTFYVDINQIGFLITHSQEELNQIIDTYMEEQYAKNCDKVLRFFGTKETGHAAEDVCRWIDNQYQKSKRERKNKRW